MLRLVEESGRGRSSSAGTRSTSPLPARGAAAYQSGRELDDSIVEQLELLLRLVEAMGFVAAKAAGDEADDFLAATATHAIGPVVVVILDRTLSSSSRSA